MKKLKVKSEKLKVFFASFLLLSTFYFLLSTSASAWVIGEPLVPCGGLNQPPCTQCELLHLVDNVMDFILIAAAPILATFFFILAGLFIMLGGAKPDMLATGKRMFNSALIGIIIVMLAWLVTNTLITTLVAPTLVLGNMPFVSADWWQLTCSSVGLKETPPGTGGPPPPQPPPPFCTTPPVCITGLQATPSTNSVTIDWTTAINSSTVVNYRINSASSWSTVTGLSNTTNHSVNITGLTSGATYEYYVISNGITSVNQVFSTLSGVSSTCQLNPNITRSPNQLSYNNGDTLQITITAQTGCTGFAPEVRVGPRVGPGGTIDWSQGIVIGSPVMGTCVATVCAVLNWTVNRFNSTTNSYEIRAVSDDGTGLCATDPSRCTQAFSASFWIN